MADNIGTEGGESLTIVNMKPAGGGVEEMNALWGQKMASNDGIYAKQSEIGHVKFAQGTLAIAQNAYGTAFLTTNGANGGSPIFTDRGLPLFDVAEVSAGSSYMTVDADALRVVNEGWTASLLDNGTMLVIWRQSANIGNGTYVWSAMGV